MSSPARTPTADELLRHAEWLGALARRLVRDPASAEDLVQETWLAALRRGPHADEDLRPWLARVVRNAARQRRRSEGARTQRERVAGGTPDDWPSPDELVARVEGQRGLIEALLALEEPLRSTLILRFFEGRTSADIARAAGLPEATVRWRVQRALVCLRERLDARHDGDRGAWCALLVPLAARAGELAAAGEAVGGTVKAGRWLVTSGTKAAIVAGALVLVVCATWIALGRQDAPAERETGPAGSVAAEERTDPAADVASDADRAPLTTPVPPDAARADAATVVATLVDVEHQPIAEGRLGADEWRGAPSVASDAEGRVELALAEAPLEPTWVELVASAPGRVPTRVGLRVERGLMIPLGAIVLAGGAELRGSVRAADGTALAGTQVLVELLDGERRGFFEAIPGYAAWGSIVPHRAHRTVPRTRAERDGSFAIGGVAPGFVRVWAFHPTWLAAWSEPVEVRAGGITRVPELLLRAFDAGSSISGRVLAPDGTPLADAHVFEEGTEFRNGAWEEVRTGVDGTFCISPRRSLPGTGVKLVATDVKDRFRPVHAELELGLRGVDLRLGALREVELVARDADGAPHAQFGASTLTATEPGHDIEYWPNERQPGGRLRVRVPEVPFRVVAFASGYEHVYAGPFDPEQAPPAVELTMVRRPGVDGVVLRDGRPVEGARVALLLEIVEPWSQAIESVAAKPWPILSRVLSTRSLEMTETDASGRFALGLLPDRPGLLRVSAPGSAPELVWGVREPRSGLVVELGGGGAIEGVARVRTRPDAPAVPVRAGFLVGASAGDGHVLYRRCDAQGRFRFDRLSPGPWQVRGAARERTPKEDRSAIMSFRDNGPIRVDCVVRAGSAVSFDLEILALPTLEGRLRVDGRGPGPWSVVLTHTGGGRTRPETALDPEGRFVVELPVEGRYDLWIAGRTPEGNALRVRDCIEVGSDSARWSLDVETSVVTGRARIDDDFSKPMSIGVARLVLDGARSVTATFGGSHPESGRWRVPVGRLLLGREGADGTWKPLEGRTLEVRPLAEQPIDLR